MVFRPVLPVCCPSFSEGTSTRLSRRPGGPGSGNWDSPDVTGRRLRRQRALSIASICLAASPPDGDDRRDSHRARERSLNPTDAAIARILGHKEVAMSTVQIRLDADLERLVAARVAGSGRPRDAVIAAALRRGLGGGRLRAILDEGRIAAVSEAEAARIASGEVAAARAERRTS